MNKEIYFWIAFFVLIVCGALYLRFYNQPTLSMQVGVANNYTVPAPFYPYQKLQLPISVKNTGGASIENMTLGFYINSNTLEIFKVSLPVGKSTVIDLNYTPVGNGNYNVSIIADPDNLYKIADRSSARYTMTLSVVPPEEAAPYLSLPHEYVEYGAYNMDSYGLIASSFIYSNFTLNKVELTDIGSANSFLYPTLSVLGPYIASFAAAYAQYYDGSVYSMWMRGYIEPSVTAVTAQGAGIKYRNYSSEGNNVTFVQIDNSTTLCSWYSEGWTKMIVANGSLNCTDVLKLNSSARLSVQPSSSLINRLPILPNATGIQVANYTRLNGNISDAGRLFLLNGSSVLEYIETNNSGTNNVCDGLVSTANSTSYCSTDFSGVAKNISKYSLISTKEFVGQYNASVFSLINTSQVLEQVPINIALLGKYNVSGRSVGFISGLVNACAFNATIGCSNVTFANSEISLDIRDNFSVQLRLNSMGCDSVGPAVAQGINYTLDPNDSVHVSVHCYADGANVTGVPLSLYLNIPLNYTVGNTTRETGGLAYII